MPVLIPPRTRLIKLAQTVLLRNPVAAVRAVVLDGHESVRADLVRPGVGALHRPFAVSDEVGFGAQGADGGGSEGAGALGFGAAEGLGGLSGEGEGGEEGGEEGYCWELHCGVLGLGRVGDGCRGLDWTFVRSDGLASLVLLVEKM